MKHRNLVVAIHPAKYGEGFVVNCKHKHADRNIYISSNIKYWRSVGRKNDWVNVMTSLLSHESLHLALTHRVDDIASMLLDNLFGNGNDYKKEYHGLCKFESRFYKRWNGKKK